MLKVNLISYCYQVQNNSPEVLGARLIFIFILLTQDSHWAWVTGCGEEYYRICNKLTFFNNTKRLQRSLILALDFYLYKDGLILLLKTKLEGDQFSSLQVLSHVWLCDPMDCSTPGLPVHHQLLDFTQTHVHWVGDAIQSSHLLSYPLLLPSIFPSIRVFSNESALHIRWPKHWSFSFNISFSNEHSGLISFRMDWFDILAVQGTLKSLLLYHSSKSSILLHSAFFMVQLSHPYMNTGKTIALTRWTFLAK